MMYPAYIDPNLVRLFGYSSRNQSDKDMYVNILRMRMDAKHNKLSQEFLDNLKISNKDVKDGLKLIINSYTGTLRAPFNNLCDELQGVSICFTGQCLLLQLGYDLMKIPTVHLSRFNTDAVEVSVDEEYTEEVYKVVHKWETLTGLEMEDDKIIKLVARDINNYCGIYQVKDGYEVHYKGGDLSRGNHEFVWDNETHKFKYTFKNDLKSNSLTIVSEALLKKLLFNIPIEDTINKCDDIFRYQLISHLGSTYEKCVQESPNGDIELQRNNRVYAGKKPSGLIVKVKYDGRRDSLANCPPNPIVDNANQCTIDDINKEWYIKVAHQKLSDFKGVKRLTEYKKTELVDMANEMGLEFDPKIKKDELIKLIEENKGKSDNVEKNKMNIYEKINAMKKDIMEVDFVLDCCLPSNLGGREYASISQYYKIINKYSEKCGLLFTWDVLENDPIERDVFKPTGKMPNHLYTVKCRARFYDTDNFKTDDGGANITPYIEYYSIASGSDINDKALSSASSMAFRNWFDKNFAPKYLTIEEFNSEVETSETTEQTVEPKIKTYVPEEKKEELTKEVVEEVQQTESDKDDVKEIIDKIMKVRELSMNPDWGASTLQSLISGELSSADILEIGLKVDNKLDSLKGE